MKKMLKVIQATINGVTGYITTDHIWGEQPLTQNPLEALNFHDNHVELAKSLATLVVPGDESIAKSGLRIDKLPEVVDIEVTSTFKVLSTKVGRELWRSQQ